MKLLGTLLHMPGIKKPSLVVILEELCNRWYMTFIKIKTFLSQIFLSLLLTSMGKKIYTHLVAYCQNRFSQDSSRHPSVTTLQRFAIVILRVAESIHYMKASAELRSSIEKEKLIKTHIADLLSLCFQRTFGFWSSCRELFKMSNLKSSFQISRNILYTLLS